MANARSQRPTSPVQAYGNGVRALMGAPVISLGAMVLSAAYFWVVEAVVLPQFRGVVAETPQANLMTGQLSTVGETHVILFQALLVLFGVVGLWTILQIFKRKTASRATWLPSLLAAPLFLAALGAWPAITQNFDGSAAPGFVAAGLLMLWMVVGGGVLNTLFVALGYDLRTHGSVNMGRALGWWRERWLGGLVVHGAMTTLVFIGVQALFIPGLIYAIITAFAVPIAMMHPEAPAFRRSRKLARGSWGPIFGVLAIGGLLAAAVDLGAVVVVDQIQMAGWGTSNFMDETGNHSILAVVGGWVTSRLMPASIPIPPIAAAVGAAIAAIMTGPVSAGLVWLYGDRHAASSAKQKAKKAKESPSDA